MGYVSGNVDFHSYIDGAGFYDWWQDKELNRTETGYTTHLITNHAVAFIQAHKERPYCLYVPHETVHYSYQGPTDKPVRAEGVEKKLCNDNEPQHAEKAYGEMLTELDRGVGEIIAAIATSGQGERTLIIFFSDNGATGPGSNGSLREKKGSLWEGVHRVPAIAYRPSIIKDGTTTDVLAVGMDLMPTMLDLAGIASEKSTAADGVSLTGVLRGEALPERTLFWGYGDAFAVRIGPWKLIVGEKGLKAPALFHLGNDRNETKDLAATEPQRVNDMLAALSAWKNDVTTNATMQPTE